MTREANRAGGHFLSAVLDRAGARHLVRLRRTGAVVVHDLETAFDSASRRKGLLGRASLATDAGLAIAPCSSVHTFFMRFPIDLVFVDRRGAVRKCYRALRPWRIAFAAGAFAVLELSAGAVDRSGIVIGDELVVSVGEAPKS